MKKLFKSKETKYVEYNDLENTEDMYNIEEDNDDLTLDAYNSNKYSNRKNYNSQETNDGNRRKSSILYPTSFSEIRIVADTLISKHEVLVDFSKLIEADKKRSKDFISGILFSLKGSLKKVDDEIFKFTIK